MTTETWTKDSLTRVLDAVPEGILIEALLASPTGVQALRGITSGFVDVIFLLARGVALAMVVGELLEKDVATIARWGDQIGGAIAGLLRLDTLPTITLLQDIIDNLPAIVDNMMRGARVVEEEVRLLGEEISRLRPPAGDLVLHKIIIREAITAARNRIQILLEE